ncbi:MAG: hypothetical protein MRY74_08375 [Neomegalonema sp.]|nr:hypothetical protein [Neomegalonema sp.]
MSSATQIEAQSMTPKPETTRGDGASRGDGIGRIQTVFAQLCEQLTLPDVDGAKAPPELLEEFNLGQSGDRR